MIIHNTSCHRSHLLSACRLPVYKCMGIFRYSYCD
nr:MAG TPA: hypothetical protein [Caudoviricetes sp.]